MAEPHTPRWPIALFTVTIFCALASTAATVYYYRSTTLLQNQTQTFSQKKAQYENEIEVLKKNVITTKVDKQSISTPVITMRRRCIMVFTEVCTDVPETTIEQREIQTAVTVEDPAIKAELELKQNELEKLSAEAVKTQERQVNLKDLVEVIRSLVSPIISLLVSVASVFVILSKRYNADSEKWAYGSIGTIVGFWLK